MFFPICFTDIVPIFYIPKQIKFKIFDPESGDETATDEIFYLVDPNTGKLATSGVRDALHSIPHSFDESKHYFYPIPENEILLNQALDQNPNW